MTSFKPDMAGGLNAIGRVLAQNFSCLSGIEKNHPGEATVVGIYKETSSERTRLTVLNSNNYLQSTCNYLLTVRKSSRSL